MNIVLNSLGRENAYVQVFTWLDFGWPDLLDGVRTKPA